MTRSLLSGMAICSLLAFAGTAFAGDTPTQTTAASQSTSSTNAGSSTQAKHHRRRRDCVHRLFPQCDRGN